MPKKLDCFPIGTLMSTTIGRATVTDQVQLEDGWYLKIENKNNFAWVHIEQAETNRIIS